MPSLFGFASPGSGHLGKWEMPIWLQNYPNCAQNRIADALFICPRTQYFTSIKMGWFWGLFGHVKWLNLEENWALIMLIWQVMFWLQKLAGCGTRVLHIWQHFKRKGYNLTQEIVHISQWNYASKQKYQQNESSWTLLQHLVDRSYCLCWFWQVKFTSHFNMIMEIINQTSFH